MEQKGEAFTKLEFLVLTWVLFGVALGFFSSRLIIRYFLYKRLALDDALVALSIFMLAAKSILMTAYTSTTFKVQAVQIDHAARQPDYKKIASLYARYQWAIAYLYFTGIWAIKGSFLAFYNPLTQRLPRMRRAWLGAIVVTVLTYIGSLLAYGFLNGNQLSKSLRNKGINYQFAADFSTDVIITAIPLTLALKSTIPTKQKFTLCAVFSMTFLITAISVVRYAVNSPSRPPAGPSWLQVWSSIEHSVSICVASAASFRAFVVQRAQASKEASTGRRQTSSSLSMKKSGGHDSSGFSRLESRSPSSSRINWQWVRGGGKTDVELVESRKVVGAEGKERGDDQGGIEREIEHRADSCRQHPTI